VTTTPHWPQALPTRRVGVAGLTDFEAHFASDPNFASAWNDVGSQLLVEGASSSQVDQAKTWFVNAVEGAVPGVTGDQAIASAKQLVLLGQTVMGAVSTVQGLLQTVESGSAPAITQAFTGVLISLGVGTGLVSAGIGAAIALGISVVLAALGDLGFFTSTAPPTFDIPGCGKWWSVPDYLVGCIGVNAKGGAADTADLRARGYHYDVPFIVAPGSPNWRSFPQPIGGVPPTTRPANLPSGYTDPMAGSGDAGWFHAGNRMMGFWRGVSWYWGIADDNPPAYRPIDLAFPNFHRIEADGSAFVGALSNLPAALAPGSDFQRAFGGAWRSNAEYQLNGLKAQPDEQVLLHTIRLWNRSHDGPAVTLDQNEATYANSLVGAAVNLVMSSDIDLLSGQSLLINTGGLKTQTPRVVTLHLGGGFDLAASGFFGSSVGANLSTGGKILAGTAAIGGAALLGSAAYVFAKKESIGAVWKNVFKTVTKPLRGRR
jgi:hypothetical protein